MYCAWNLITYHIGSCFLFNRQSVRSDQGANRWRSSVRGRMLRLFWAEWHRRVYLVGAQNITQLGSSIRWWIWPWIVSGGEFIVLSYDVMLFEDNCLCVFASQYSVFLLGSHLSTHPSPVCIYFIIISEIIIARKLTLSTSCVAAAVV